jgi:cytochrome bd-type quinol oxidase subunit 2
MTTNRFGFFATLIILLVSLAFGTVHFFLRRDGFLPENFSQTPFILFYVFLVPLSLLTLWFVLWRFKKDRTSAGGAYFITVFFKMFGSALFLYPGMVADASLMKPTAVQFMIIFFLLLLIETILLAKLLNARLDEKSKNDENQMGKS